MATTPTFYTSPYGTKINTTGITGNPLNRITTLANSAHGTAAAALAQRVQARIPKAPAVPAANPPTVNLGGTTTAPPAQTMPAPNPAPGGAPTQGATATSTPLAAAPAGTATTAESEFPTEAMFEPQNYQGSPLYQFQVKSGEDQLAKSLAAKGLTGSGNAIQQELDVQQQAAAADTQNMTQVAEDNANRLQTYQEDQATQQEGQSNDQWNHYLDLASLMAAQSPYNSAVAGLNSTASNTTAAANAQANYLKQAYQTIFGSGGRGSGFTPVPLPTGPDYSNITPATIAAGSSDNQGWLKLLTSGLSSIL